MYEFVDVVRTWAPRKRRELEAWLGVKVRNVHTYLIYLWVGD